MNMNDTGAAIMGFVGGATLVIFVLCCRSISRRCWNGIVPAGAVPAAPAPVAAPAPIVAPEQTEDKTPAPSPTGLGAANFTYEKPVTIPAQSGAHIITVATTQAIPAAHATVASPTLVSTQVSTHLLNSVVVIGDSKEKCVVSSSPATPLVQSPVVPSRSARPVPTVGEFSSPPIHPRIAFGSEKAAAR